VAEPPRPTTHLGATAQRVDAVCEAGWREREVTPGDPADWRLVARRLSLALCGTIPSLEEIRLLERRPEAQRIDWWVGHLLGDRRCADYFAERLARAFVGTNEGPFLIYRRRRFVTWLADQLAGNRPYDVLVRELIASEGLWTDAPATNFVTAQERDPVRLASRTARAFLGLRIDCAQCHDHPFAEWKQRDFEGLAAFYADVQQAVTGIKDTSGKFEVEDRKTLEKRVVEPAVPFGSELLPAGLRRREQLAQWVTDRRNPYFAKAIANRVWALLFGRAIIEPADDLEGTESLPGVLDVLAEDLQGHGYDLRRLIGVIAATRAFRTSSSGSGTAAAHHEEQFASFPVTRLRPEQVAGALCQSAKLQTIDAASHVLIRFGRFINEREFVDRFGDAGEEELLGRNGTIPQRLLLMNGKMPGERIQADLFSAAGRLSSLAPSDQSRVRIAFWITLTRDPTLAEAQYFAARLHGRRGDERSQAVEDMMWALINSTEFSWNH
jgi:hypothetical protein